MQGTLTDVGGGDIGLINAKESFALSVLVAAEETFTGVARVEISDTYGAAWEAYVDEDGLVHVYSGIAEALEGAIVEVTVKNPTNGLRLVRVAVTDAGDADGVTYSGESVIGDRVRVLFYDGTGREVAWLRDDGGIEFLGNLVVSQINGVPTEGIITSAIGSFEAILVNGDTPTPASLVVYTTYVFTSGSAGEEALTLGDGTGVVVGQRKLVKLNVQANESDIVVLDHDNMADTDGAPLAAATVDVEGGFILVEWSGVAWQVVFASDATITPA
jgi:hypothetical protein